MKTSPKHNGKNNATLSIHRINSDFKFFIVVISLAFVAGKFSMQRGIAASTSLDFLTDDALKNPVAAQQMAGTAVPGNYGSPLSVENESLNLHSTHGVNASTREPQTPFLGLSLVPNCSPIRFQNGGSSVPFVAGNTRNGLGCNSSDLGTNY